VCRSKQELSPEREARAEPGRVSATLTEARRARLGENDSTRHRYSYAAKPPLKIAYKNASKPVSYGP